MVLFNRDITRFHGLANLWDLTVLLSVGTFLRTGSVWLGQSDETPNKYFSQSYHWAPVPMFCHFLKWFLSFTVCSEKNTGKKDYVLMREIAQLKPIDSKGKCVLWSFEFLFPMNTMYVDHMCFRYYLHLFSSIYHQFQHRIQHGKQSGINLCIFKMLLKSFRSCKVLNWKENLGSNNKVLERQTITSESSIWILLCKKHICHLPENRFSGIKSSSFINATRNQPGSF